MAAVGKGLPEVMVGLLHVVGSLIVTLSAVGAGADVSPATLTVKL